MKNISFFKFLAFALVLCLLLPGHAYPQRERKKRSTDAQVKEMRLREAQFFFTEGMKYFILEDYTKALGSFQRVAELNPEEPVVHYKIAEILSKSAKDVDINQAAVSIEKALKLDKKNKYFYLLAADIYTRQNSFPKAEQSLENMMKEVKGTEEHLYQLAAIYQFDRKPDEAIKVYNSAESVLGVNEISSLQKQKIYLDQGKINEAIAEGEKLLAANPDEERYVMGFAETLAQKGQQKKAIEAVEKFLSRHPEAGSAKILLSGFYRKLGMEKRAREILEQVFTDPSIDISSKLMVMSSYNSLLRQNRSKNVADPALESFTLSLFQALKSQNPEDPNVHVVGGDLYLSLNQKEEAEREYIAAVQRGSASFDAWQNLLSLESEGNKFDSLIFHSEQGLEIFPNQAILYYFNGYGHIRKHLYREAAFSLERAKKLVSGNPSLLNDINGMLGEAYNGTKEYARSDMAFEEALSVSPNNDFILNNYSYYLALRKENLDKAERMAAQATRDHPANAAYLDTYAWVLYVREKYKEARKVMERTLALPAPSAVYFEHYGDILFRLEDIEGAVKQWEKARSLTSQHDLIDKKIANRRLY